MNGEKAAWIRIEGRIDGMSAPEVDRRIQERIRAGERDLVLDLSQVGYLSSAGLRVFISARKKLGKVDGRVILFKVPPKVMNVFTMSGLGQLFRCCATEAEVDAALRRGEHSADSSSCEIDGITLRTIDTGVGPGRLRTIGSQEKLPRSAYGREDVVPVQPDSLRFGTGLAALGEDYDDFSHYFGEAVVLERSLYVYPAVRHPAVDYMIHAGESESRYPFLHGFSFEGKFRFLVAFDCAGKSLELKRLAALLLQSSQVDLLGLVFLSESEGLWGINLKRIPTAENRPPGGEEIFSQGRFAEWMNFPVEPAHQGCLVAGAGLVTRNRDRLRPEVRELIPKESSLHVHGAVFGREPVGRNPERFEEELERVTGELQPVKVQHLLGRTLLGRGLAGIVELGS